jgi:hypothetical protein
MVEKDLALIVGDSGIMSFWDIRSGSIVCKADISGTDKR